MCDCDRGGVQDERHILFDCSKTTDVRGRYGISEEVYGSISDLMDNHDPTELVDFVGCLHEDGLNCECVPSLDVDF